MKPFSREIISTTFNNKPIGVLVQVYCIPDDDYSSLKDDFPTKAERARVTHEIKQGNIQVCSIEVRASALGIDGADQLSGCFIASPRDITDIITCHGMVDNAIKELFNELKMQHELLQSYFII